MPERGPFISIEGIEGVGKSTHSRLLARAIEARGRTVVLTREPGGGDRVGEILRDLLKDPAVWRGLDLAEIYLYAAARAHHIEKLILPALERGHVVVCDRFLDSTRAYQGYGRGRPLELIEKVHALAPLTLRPDRTILLDAPVEVALGRTRDRAESARPGYDDEDVAFFGRVRDGFLRIAAQEPGRVRIVREHGDVATVHGSVVAAIADLFPGIVPASPAP
ncbi:MAG: dTMP kinase [Acidobacteria bacterium]|nr:dTMP kinase [Acidobacteriota bacterium]